MSEVLECETADQTYKLCAEERPYERKLCLNENAVKLNAYAFKLLGDT